MNKYEISILEIKFLDIIERLESKLFYVQWNGDCREQT